MKILKYTSGLLLVMVFSSLQAQNAGSRIRGPRIGYDLASLVLLYSEPGRMVYSLSVDYEAWQDIYPVLEFGFQSVNLSREDYSYTSNGMFARMGVDVNLLKYEQPNVYEMFYAGLRYGISYMTQQAGNIHVRGDYFDGLSGGSLVENQLNAHFISFVGGVRVELFDNFFMGWSVMANLKVAQVKDASMTPYYFPGFGKGGKRTGLVISYAISYRIPMQRYNPKKIIKKKEIPVDQGTPTPDRPR